MSPDVRSAAVAAPAQAPDRRALAARGPPADRRMLVAGRRVALLLVAVLGLWEGSRGPRSSTRSTSRCRRRSGTRSAPGSCTAPRSAPSASRSGTRSTRRCSAGSSASSPAWCFGIALGRIPFLADVLGPYIKVLNSLPRIVLAPIFVIWFGLGPASKVASAVVLVFFPVFFNAFQGAREVDRNLVANARILGASDRQVTLQVVIPSATSWIFTSLHVSFGFALIGAIVGEYIGATKGIGLLVAAVAGHVQRGRCVRRHGHPRRRRPASPKGC